MEHFTSIPEKDLEDMTIEDYFGKDSEFFHSSLWWCYHSMLAFKPITVHWRRSGISTDSAF